ncbi:MAG: M20/M25/M40 family metallo-hydrolase [Candidatus Zixiibacteriota bacterium]|nr:MAG: M20/M25/M40 family metallo-hydrolase [candidate division Zixibacteria bacterium]
MRSSTWHVLTYLSICILVSSAMAEDIGLVRLSSQGQARIATSILGTACGKAGIRFVVLMDDDKANRLKASGIAVETAIRDVIPEDCYLVFCREVRLDQSGIDLSHLGRIVDLGSGTQVVEMTGLTASLFSRTTGCLAVPMPDRRIRFHYHPPVVMAPTFPPAEYPTDTLAALVNPDSVYNYTKRLEDFYTRYVGTDSIDHARDWLVQKFSDFGYVDVSTPSFEWNSQTHYNVKAVKPGTEMPGEVIVVGAHYDALTLSQPEPGWIHAPGADDNASGVSMVLEVARILADVPLRRTVVFFAFTAEEVGLLGSEAAAAEFEATGADIIVMFNADCIGFTGGEPWIIDILAGGSYGYSELTASVAGRVTAVTPDLMDSWPGSDHTPFHDRGYDNVTLTEANANFYVWHTLGDVTSILDFPYQTEVVKMATSAIALTAQLPSLPTPDTIIDVGDGQSLEISWSDCQDDLEYVIHRGLSSGEYLDSVVVGSCTGSDSYVWSGLTEGVDYYFMVVGITPDGYHSLFAREVSLDPRRYPRAPVEFTAKTDSASVVLDWQANAEADFSYYNVYRRLSGVGDYQLLESNVISESLVYTSAHGGSAYDYVITAVDADGYESDPSAGVSALSAAFNGGPCIVDAFYTENQYMPDQEHQEAYFDTLMGDRSYTLLKLDDASDVLTRSQAGRYSTIIWIDDDYTQTNKTIAGSDDALSWYCAYGANLLISGFYVIQNWTETLVPEGHVLYTDFGVSGYDYWSSPDFVGAHGQNGWPSVEIEPGRGLMEYGYIPVLDTLPGATVIYTYDSFIDWPDWEGKPVGVIWEGAAGKRILLSFPIYYLSPASAQAMMAKVLEYFADPFEPVNEGDANDDGVVDIGDLTAMIDYLFISYTPPESLNGSDVNADCTVDMGDITWMIKYLFLQAAPPLPGCVE